MYEEQGAWFSWHILQADLSQKDWQWFPDKQMPIISLLLCTPNFWKEIICCDLDVALFVEGAKWLSDLRDFVCFRES